jgi:hypothetical protein
MKVEMLRGFVKLAGVHVALPMCHPISIYTATWTSGVRDGVMGVVGVCGIGEISIIRGYYKGWVPVSTGKTVG